MYKVVSPTPGLAIIVLLMAACAVTDPLNPTPIPGSTAKSLQNTGLVGSCVEERIDNDSVSAQTIISHCRKSSSLGNTRVKPVCITEYDINDKGKAVNIFAACTNKSLSDEAIKTTRKYQFDPVKLEPVDRSIRHKSIVVFKAGNRIERLRNVDSLPNPIPTGNQY